MQTSSLYNDELTSFRFCRNYLKINERRANSITSNIYIYIHMCIFEGEKKIHYYKLESELLKC